MTTHALFLAVSLLAACGPPQEGEPDAHFPDAGPPPDADWRPVLQHYEWDVHQFEAEAGLPAEWSDWMIAKKDAYAKAYVRGRTRRHARAEVSYDYVIPYDPPWTSEEEHLAALETLAERTYPGWDFSFSFDDPEADLHVVIGYSGENSHASGNTVRLVWEGIFGHEFGHVAGIAHHYCSSVNDLCNLPPGEGKCIMSRNSVSWGPTEQFLLNLDGRGDDLLIGKALDNLNDRYPEGYPAHRP